MTDAVLFDDTDKEDFLVVTFPPDEEYVRRLFPTLEKANAAAKRAAWNPILIRRTTTITHEFLEIK